MGRRFNSAHRLFKKLGIRLSEFAASSVQATSAEEVEGGKNSVFEPKTRQSSLRSAIFGVLIWLVGRSTGDRGYDHSARLATVVRDLCVSAPLRETQRLSVPAKDPKTESPMIRGLWTIDEWQV